MQSAENLRTGVWTFILYYMGCGSFNAVLNQTPAAATAATKIIFKLYSAVTANLLTAYSFLK